MGSPHTVLRLTLLPQRFNCNKQESHIFFAKVRHINHFPMLQSQQKNRSKHGICPLI